MSQEQKTPPAKYLVDAQPAVAKLLKERERLVAMESEHQAKAAAMRQEATEAHKKAEAVNALAALGEETAAAADKADDAAGKADKAAAREERSLKAVRDARAVVEGRLETERAAAQKQVDAAIWADLQKLTQEAVDATERANEIHTALAELDRMASSYSNIPALKLRNYMPGYAGGQTLNGHKVSLSVAEDWICKVRGRGLAKASKLESAPGGLVARTIKQYGGAA